MRIGMVRGIERVAAVCPSTNRVPVPPRPKGRVINPPAAGRQLKTTVWWPAGSAGPCHFARARLRKL
jgi:hypothetical protein